MLEFCHITKRQGKFTLSDINFKLETGYLLGIVGKNGAGKSTLIKCMLQEDCPYTGDIFFQGKNIKNHRKEFLATTAYIADDNKFFMEKSALKNVEIFEGFYETMDIERFKTYMKEMNLSHGKKVGQMSRGEFIRFQIAFARARDAKLYLLDEATAGMDPVFRKEFYDMLRQLLAEEATIIMTTHVQSDLNRNMDYICRLEEGKMISYVENTGDMDVTGEMIYG